MPRRVNQLDDVVPLLGIHDNAVDYAERHADFASNLNVLALGHESRDEDLKEAVVWIKSVTPHVGTFFLRNKPIFSP